jgi:hypothetical protein
MWPFPLYQCSFHALILTIAPTQLAEIPNNIADSSAVFDKRPIALAPIVTRLAAKVRARATVRTANLAGDIGERVSVEGREVVPAML